MTGELIELGPHTNMTPEEALETAKRSGLKEVLVLGYDEGGSFVSLSSGMLRRDALWIIKHAELNVLKLAEED